MSSRAAILASVRAGLAAARARGESAPPDPRGEPLATWKAPLDLGAHFRARLAAVGAHVHEARDEAEAARALSRVLDELGAASLAVSDAPLARRVARVCGSKVELVEADAPRSALLEASAGLTCAQWGIAETGTLVLESERERHRLVSLLPPVHVALLSTSCIVPALGDAMARISSGGSAAMSRAVTFVTGPSRTADIELRLVVGVHGPKVLHVILLADSEQAGSAR